MSQVLPDRRAPQAYRVVQALRSYRPTGSQGTAGTAGGVGATGPTGSQGTAGTAGVTGPVGAPVPPRTITPARAACSASPPRRSSSCRMAAIRSRSTGCCTRSRRPGSRPALRELFLTELRAEPRPLDTAYLVSVYNNSGTLAINFHFRTSLVHITDTAAGNVGVEIVPGSSAYYHSRHDSGERFTQFQDSNALRGVISWFNRRNRSLAGSNTGAVKI